MTFTEFRNVRVHETADPGTIICEYDLHGVVTRTGEPFVFSYILLITVRNGQIALVRDYMDTFAMTAALGSLDGASS
jgi:ketosteroid isomerase-like protein